LRPIEARASNASLPVDQLGPPFSQRAQRLNILGVGLREPEPAEVEPV
jgi:hypothetical protein